MNEIEKIAYERNEATAMAYKEVEQILMQSLSNAQMMIGMNTAELRDAGGNDKIRREGRQSGLNAWLEQTKRDMKKLETLYNETKSEI